MEKVFDEGKYRKYLKNHYNVMKDKFDYQKRKEIVDQYSEEELQKIVDDTKDFSLYILEELENTELSLVDSVFMKTEIHNELKIDTGLHGGYSADILYNPNGYSKDFYVSNHLLNEFLSGSVNTEYETEEFFLEDEDVGITISVLYLTVVMKKEKFKEYKNYLGEKPKVMTKK